MKATSSIYPRDSVLDMYTCAYIMCMSVYVCTYVWAGVCTCIYAHACGGRGQTLNHLPLFLRQALSLAELAKQVRQLCSKPQASFLYPLTQMWMCHNSQLLKCVFWGCDLGLHIEWQAFHWVSYFPTPDSVFNCKISSSLEQKYG